MTKQFLFLISMVLISSRAFAFHWLQCEDTTKNVIVRLLLDANNPLIAADLQDNGESYHYQHTEGPFQTVGQEQINVFFTTNLVFSIAADGKSGTLFENQSSASAMPCIEQ